MLFLFKIGFQENVFNIIFFLFSTFESFNRKETRPYLLVFYDNFAIQPFLSGSNICNALKSNFLTNFIMKIVFV